MRRSTMVIVLTSMSTWSMLIGKCPFPNWLFLTIFIRLTDFWIFHNKLLMKMRCESFPSPKLCFQLMWRFLTYLEALILSSRKSEWAITMHLPICVCQYSPDYCGLNVTDVWRLDSSEFSIPSSCRKSRKTRIYHGIIYRRNVTRCD